MYIKILVEIPVGRSLVKPRRRWKVKLYIDLKEIRWKSVEWFHLAQDRDL
jgi:hypothetical protein